MASKEVLVDFQGRKRPLVFPTHEDANEEKHLLFQGFMETFADVLNGSEKYDDLTIQVKSEKWSREYVDLRESRIADNFILSVSFGSSTQVHSLWFLCWDI